LRESSYQLSAFSRHKHMSQIVPDIKEEALRIIGCAEEHGLRLRLLGGLAILLHSPSATRPPLQREYPDIDFVTGKGGGPQVESLLPEMGYTPNQAFNMFNGDHRMLFYDEVHGRQIDVFIGRFQMCHPLPVSQRLHLEPITLPLAELLLTKMQIVHTNEKDMRDICALLIDHPFGEGDDETVNLALIAALCGNDWGLWKTVTLNAQKLQEFCAAYDLPEPAKLILGERLNLLQQRLDSVPKSLKWKMRSKIGERIAWYELPEEVQRG
jgi:hypothetical protein